MITNLQQFDGMQPGSIIKVLRAQGFDVIGSGTDSVMLGRDNDAFLVCITSFAGQAEAFAQLCRAHPHNPLLPMTSATHRSESDPPVFITVMERLHALSELPEDIRGVTGGFARAFALLIDGHSSHDTVHIEMMKNPHVAAAAKAMIGVLEESLAENSDTFLYYDSGFSEDYSGPLEEWFPDNIMFRANDDGSYQPVFVDPFREGVIGGKENRQALRQQVAAMIARLESIAPKKAGPASAGLSPRL